MMMNLIFGQNQAAVYSHFLCLMLSYANRLLEDLTLSKKDKMYDGCDFHQEPNCKQLWQEKQQKMQWKIGTVE